MLTASRDAKLFTRCGDFRQGDPGGTVGGVGEVEGIAIAGISCEKEAKGREGVVMYRAFHGFGEKGRVGSPEAMS